MTVMLHIDNSQNQSIRENTFLRDKMVSFLYPNVDNVMQRRNQFFWQHVGYRIVVRS